MKTKGSPRPLACLVHVANNLIKDMGRGYVPDEPSEYDPNVLNRVVVVYCQIAPGLQIEVEQPVARDLGEHMIQKTDSGLKIVLTRTV